MCERGYLMENNSIWDYKFKRFSVSRSITDAMWRWEMEVDKSYPTPPLFKPIQAVKTVGNKEYCILVGFPINRRYSRADGERSTIVEGYSYGWYVANRPIRPEKRLVPTSLDGKTIKVNDPIGYVRSLIHDGGNNPCGLIPGLWDTETPGWGSASLPYQQFESSDSSFIQNVIDEICEYTGLFYYDYWKKSGGLWVPASYMRHQSKLQNTGDNGFGTPAKITIRYDGTVTNSAGIVQSHLQNNRVMVDTEAEVCGDDWKNSVWVDGVIQGTMKGFSARIPAAWNATETVERPYQYCFQIPPTVVASGADITDAQAKNIVSTRAQQLYNLLTAPTERYSVKFFNRYDIQLLQELRFEGFGSQIPTGDLRIVEIEYSIDADQGEVCSCRCMTDRSWSASRRLSLILKRDWASVSDSIARSQESKKKQVIYGKVVGKGPKNTIILRNEASGALTYASVPNQ